jgi:hypothetical protein
LREAEAGGLSVQGQPALCSKTLSQNKKENSNSKEACPDQFVLLNCFLSL